jgi:hypothetical protein
MPVILATRDNRGLKPAQANSSLTPYLKKPFTKIGLAKWLKVKALSASPKSFIVKRLDMVEVSTEDITKIL